MEPAASTVGSSSPTRFLGRKGDVLIGSADLVHCRSEITDPPKTRRSLVAHYSPLGVYPHYFSFCPERGKIRRYAEDLYYSSWPYDLDG